MEFFENIVNAVNDLVWSNALVFLFLAVGLGITIWFGVPQLRHIKKMAKLAIKGGNAEVGVNAYQAFATTVGSRVGTGNIAGVATAIFFGGPGAVFWMWLCSVIGAASAFVETTLAQAYKIKRNGEYVGGPYYYIEKGMKLKPFAVLFAIVALIGPGLMFPGLQTYTIAESFGDAFGTPNLLIGTIVTVLIGLVVFGGIKRIAKLAEFMAPIMCIIYLLLMVIVVVMHFGELPGVFKLIFSSAFGREEMFAGLFGTMIAWGIKRGVYSNEAGMGSGAIVSAAADAEHPAEQGMVQMFSVFVDTLFICSASAIIILITSAYNVQAPDGASMLVENLPGIEYGILFVQHGLVSSLGGWAGKVLAVVIVMFIFTSLTGYYYEAESSVQYLTEGNKTFQFVYRVLFLFATIFGVLVKDGSVLWSLGDLGVGLMAWVNILALIVLAPKARKMMKDYEAQIKAGDKIHFDTEKFGITDETGAWDKKKK